VWQVRSDWGIRDSVGVHGWQNVMKQYLRQDRMQALEALDKLNGGRIGVPAAPASAADPDEHGA
jgi:hypothetical protein